MVVAVVERSTQRSTTLWEFVVGLLQPRLGVAIGRDTTAAADGIGPICVTTTNLGLILQRSGARPRLAGSHYAGHVLDSSYHV